MKIIIYLILCSLSYLCLGTSLKSAPHIQNKTLIKIPKNWVALKKELKNRRSVLTPPLIQKRLQRIYTSIQKKNSEKKSIKLINKLEKLVQNRHSELTKLYVLKAQIYSSTDNIKQALLFYNKAINLKKLSYNKYLSVVYDQARLYFLQNNIKKASQLTEQLLYLDDNNTASIYILKATILIEKKQKKQALKLVLKAINSTKNPKQSWLHLAATLHLQNKQYILATRILLTLTANYPDRKIYWKSLSNVFLYLKKDDKALATLDLAYKLDFLETETEIIHLAGLLIYQELYFKAAHLMQKSMSLKKIKRSRKNYEILGDCWIRASETKKALHAYNISARTAKNGKILAKIGRIHLQNRNWQSSINNLKKALKKGEIKKPAQLYIWIGAALVNLKKYKQAISYFQKVITLKNQVHYLKIARYWIDYIHKIPTPSQHIKIVNANTK